jgi:hypothetical protein
MYPMLTPAEALAYAQAHFLGPQTLGCVVLEVVVALLFGILIWRHGGTS